MTPPAAGSTVRSRRGRGRGESDTAKKALATTPPPLRCGPIPRNEPCAAVRVHPKDPLPEVAPNQGTLALDIPVPGPFPPIRAAREPVPEGSNGIFRMVDSGAAGLRSLGPALDSDSEASAARGADLRSRSGEGKNAALKVTGNLSTATGSANGSGSAHGTRAEPDRTLSTTSGSAAGSTSAAAPAMSRKAKGARPSDRATAVIDIPPGNRSSLSAGAHLSTSSTAAAATIAAATVAAPADHDTRSTTTTGHADEKSGGRTDEGAGRKTGGASAAKRSFSARNTGRAPNGRTDGLPSADTSVLLPEARLWAAAFIQAAMEVTCGLRPSAQLVRWTTPDVHGKLVRRSALTARALKVGSSVGAKPRLRALVLCSPRAGVCEVSAVIAETQRVRAVAFRMEGLHGRWRVTELEMQGRPED
jgi:hypothetical protein